jgi:hypothetical protein
VKVDLIKYLQNYVSILQDSKIMTFQDARINLGSIASVYVPAIIRAVQQEYPNHMQHLITGPEDRPTPRELHPAFYGCFDWHSSVEMHWALIRLLRLVPEKFDQIPALAILDAHLTESALLQETKYMLARRSFERPYGWGWALTLAHELIQNADDAKTATSIAFDIAQDSLLVDNDGVFSDCKNVEAAECPWKADGIHNHRCDFHRFRYIAAGDKRAEEGTTGAFGIGFIAVYQILTRRSRFGESIPSDCDRRVAVDVERELRVERSQRQPHLDDRYRQTSGRLRKPRCVPSFRHYLLPWPEALPLVATNSAAHRRERPGRHPLRRRLWRLRRAGTLGLALEHKRVVPHAYARTDIGARNVFYVFNRRN